MKLGDLPKGAIFETVNGGIRAVKSEYVYPDGQCECVLLVSGEYAHFPDGNSEEVREIREVSTAAKPRDGGGQAFPTDGAYSGYVGGMSLRDWFAGQALAGILAAEAGAEGAGAFKMSHGVPELNANPDAFAGVAYTLADAMLAARK
jgi:hypothetical protein